MIMINPDDELPPEDLEVWLEYVIDGQPLSGRGYLSSGVWWRSLTGPDEQISGVTGWRPTTAEDPSS